jgi:outer membrane beta-barrel protein
MAVTLALPTASAQAQEDVDDEEIGPSYSAMVVQNRKYDPTHEFSATLGLLPLDAFTKGLTLSGSYTLHFSQLVAWEIVQFSYSFPLDTDLKDELDAFDLRPTPFEVLNYYATTNFVWKPLYWKGSWLNDSLIYGEMFLTVGGGYGWFTRSGRPGLDLGVGFRIFGSELLSFRLDTRYLMFFSDFEQFDIKDELWIGLGTSLSF